MLRPLLLVVVIYFLVAFAFALGYSIGKNKHQPIDKPHQVSVLWLYKEAIHDQYQPNDRRPGPTDQ